jgi:hypothetical protein
MALENDTAILLIDKSASVSEKFNDTHTIYDYFQKIITNLNYEKFKIIFWSSEYGGSSGITKFNKTINKDKINQYFQIAKHEGMNGTTPSTGFKNIEESWIHLTNQNNIYLITDGVFDKGLEEIKLSNEIKKLFNKFSNINLHIITVQKNIIDFTDIEKCKNMAGNDVFKIIQNNGLTKFITEFKSYTPNNLDGFVHIEKVICPDGFISYGKVLYSKLKINDMINDIYSDITINKNNEEVLIKIIQNLSNTIKQIFNDTLLKEQDYNLEMFSNLFNDTCIDTGIVEYMLLDAVKLENEGKSIIYAEYRNRMKNLYASAQQMLEQNTKTAVNMREDCISFPINDKIIIANNPNVAIQLCGKNYPKSSIIINEFKLPLIPLVRRMGDYTDINKQCLRQYIRAIIASQYNLQSMDDIIIYVVLALNLKIQLSNLNQDIKNSFINISNIMLMKKRFKSDITEIEFLHSGNQPFPNIGGIQKFYDYMNVVNKILKLNLRPLTMWYILCLGLGDEILINKQIIHCNSDVSIDFPMINHTNLLTNITVDKIELSIIPEELDYLCPITLEQTNLTGGYKLKQHIVRNSLCNPKYVFSNEGYNQLILSENPYCPNCYTPINNTNFDVIPPKINETIEIFKGIENPFSNYVAPIQETKIVEPIKSNDNCKTIVYLRGTVGSGKSTFRHELIKKLTDEGIEYVVISMDDYVLQNNDFKTATFKIKNDIEKSKNKNNKIVYIVDTCNERVKNHHIFDIKIKNSKCIEVFPNYNNLSNLDHYYDWTLKNILSRTDITNSCLNPVKSGLNVCIDVHFKKILALFNTHTFNKRPYNTTVESLNENAEKYQTFLNTSYNLDDEIQKVFNFIIN